MSLVSQQRLGFICRSTALIAYKTLIFLQLFTSACMRSTRREAIRYPSRLSTCLVSQHSCICLATPTSLSSLDGVALSIILSIKDSNLECTSTSSIVQNIVGDARALYVSHHGKKVNEEWIRLFLELGNHASFHKYHFGIKIF